MNYLSNFGAAMIENGIIISDNIIPDGVLHRCHVKGDSVGSKNAWYVFHNDIIPCGAFGCWKRGISKTWCAKTKSEMTPQEIREHEKCLSLIVEQRKTEQQKIQSESKRRANEIWGKAKSVTGHLYLENKRVKSYGLKVSSGGKLLIPVMNNSGEIESLQFISQDGEKVFLTGGKKKGNYYLIGTPNDRIFISEGYATAASIFEASNCAVACAFDSGNLLSVSRAVHAKYPNIEITIAGDDDVYTSGNPGRVKSEEAAKALNCNVVFPDFSICNKDNQPTDWNDLHSLAGLDEVKRQLSLVSQSVVSTAEILNADAQCAILCRRASDIQTKPISWLWKGRIARGKVSMIAGNPGLGKSQLTANMAAIVTTGREWPLEKTRSEKSGVIFLSAEDDPADTIVPRLKASGANTNLITIIDAVRSGFDSSGNEIPRHFSLESDLIHLDSLLAKLQNTSLIVIDPITAYLGNTDSHRTADVRALLAPLSKLAEKHNVAIVCVSHLNKGGNKEALMRVTGSLGFVAAARAAYVVVKDKDDSSKRLFLPAKNNLGNDQTGLDFLIESCELENNIQSSRIVWGQHIVTITADEAMAIDVDSQEKNAIQEAEDFLNDLLCDSPVSANKVKKASESSGHSWRTIRRAKDNLGIEPKKVGKEWVWSLPDRKNNEDVQDDQDVQQKSLDTLSSFGHLDYQIVCDACNYRPPFCLCEKDNVHA